MKYYSKIFFSLFILLHILTIGAIIFYSWFLFILSGMGCSAGCPSNYGEDVALQILLPVSVMMLFLFFSIIILFLQQYKNPRLGYLTIILVPFDIYIIYKLFLFLPVWGEEIFWLTISTMSILAFFIPFYVLMKLIQEDFFKNRRIAK
ncbi:MAG: hypothetical protein US31_C0003G0002 [Berkelbacteria bacterium GW2011_GWA1_36_9]|uniref:Uncharacterized protein n=1 Tax=Berkelbacteria bacterium GW2011_GWA1_36_9 TaxID=1618331 RepID=A0A0G0FHQ8_9BACT|nr:MAG: hypothetical protein US31_C0003G0002 [Berkelbacteria bacterium GW2011_GWA1_36_9]